jgi:leukotriene-A4 hydrolase
MENPCLTFATPTLLAGDRSLANVIAHEIAHSWTGNLVTNHTWEHFWLNEGWTRWLENRILVRCEEHDGKDGEALYNFSMQESLTHLEDAIMQFGADSPLTALCPPLDGIDPDDAFSAVPYEKGLSLLNLLTRVVGGRPEFEAFCKEYIGSYQQKSLTSADFRDFFLGYTERLGVDASEVDWDTWFTTPGMPPIIETFADTLGGACTAAAERWLADHAEEDSKVASAAEYAAWPSQLKIHFLEVLLSRSTSAATPPMSIAALERMDRLYGLTASKNSELRVRWQRLCIRHRKTAIVPEVLAFLKQVGRMKFVRPLYRDLYAWEEQRAAAVETFKEWRENYHPIASKMLAQDLKLDS